MLFFHVPGAERSCRCLAEWFARLHALAGWLAGNRKVRNSKGMGAHYGLKLGRQWPSSPGGSDHVVF